MSAEPQTESRTALSEDMLGFLLHGAGDLRLATLRLPEPGPGQALIRVRRAGICGSDMHYFAHGRIGRFVPKRPLVLGHEVAGEVAAIGPGAPADLLGRRVAVDPSINCGACRACREGRYNLCDNMRFLGSASCDPHLDGGFAEYLAMPAANCHPLPDSVGWTEAALVEPLSVALHALRRAGDVGGRSLLVTGGGPIGLLVAMAARAFGAGPVVVSDPAPLRRALALEIGADGVIDPADPDWADRAEADGHAGFDVAVEAAGAVPALGQCLEALRRGGIVVQVGTLPAEVMLPLNDVMAKELTLAGSFRFANVFATALDLLARGRLPAARLISAVYPLPDMVAAMARATARGEVVKVQVEA